MAEPSVEISDSGCDQDNDNSSNNQNHNPTLVFPHMYHQGEDELMSTMLVSYPVPGKHLVFDGRLLHGAPSSSALVRRHGKPEQQQHDKSTDGTLPGTSKDVPKGETKANSEATNDESNNEDKIESTLGVKYRVTFLVNLWMDHKPANVLPLDTKTRQALLERQKQQEETFGTTLDTSNWLQSPTAAASSDDAPVMLSDAITMIPKNITEVTINTEEDLTAPFQSRIELPFVCKGITWDDEDYYNSDEDEDDNDDSDGNNDNSGLVVVTFPPPAATNDTMMVKFGPGMQAYMEYLEEKEGYSEFQQRRDQEGSGILHEDGTAAGDGSSPQLVEEDYV